MNLFQQVCKITAGATTQQFLYNAIPIGISCFYLVLLYIIFSRVKPKIKKLFITLGTGIGCFVLWIILSFGLWLFLGLDDNPPSYEYHPLNAMIKYRCYKDHIYCPVNEHDVRVIAPDYLKSQLDKAQITYQFYSQTKAYTLIVRNNNAYLNNDRAVIFDPRLAKIKNYGYGLDFFDADIVNNCDGTYKITNPPPFPGPWSKIK